MLNSVYAVRNLLFGEYAVASHWFANVDAALTPNKSFEWTFASWQPLSHISFWPNGCQPVPAAQLRR